MFPAPGVPDVATTTESASVTAPRIAGVPVGRLEVVVSGLRNREGFLHVALYDQPDGFPGDSRKAFLTHRTAIRAVDTKVVFEGIPYGEYAVSVLHDEDGDGRRRMRWWVLPREGTGVSLGGDGRASWSKSLFRMDRPLLRLPVRMTYP